MHREYSAFFDAGLPDGRRRRFHQKYAGRKVLPDFIYEVIAPFALFGDLLYPVRLCEAIRSDNNPEE